MRDEIKRIAIDKLGSPLVKYLGGNIPRMLDLLCNEIVLNRLWLQDEFKSDLDIVIEARIELEANGFIR